MSTGGKLHGQVEMLLCKLPDFLEVRKCHDQNCLSLLQASCLSVLQCGLHGHRLCLPEGVHGWKMLTSELYSSCYVNPAVSLLTKTKLFIFSQVSLGYLLL